MIGHIKPPLCRLPSHIRNSYKNLYCSICYSLRQQFGLMSSACINNELTLTVLAFNQHFTAQSKKVACPAHLFCTKRFILKHQIIDSAAQFSLLLAWVKITDWATDNPAFYKTALKKILDRKVKPILSTIQEETKQVIDNYIKLIKNQAPDFYEVRRMSALLAKQIAKDIAGKADTYQDSLETRLKVIELIGEIIAIADPILDLKADIKNQEFNPVVEFAQRNNTTIQEEYEKLTQEYYAIDNKINQYIQSLSRDDANQVFVKTLSKSLIQLSKKVENITEMSPASNDKDERDNKKEPSICRYCDCCDCFDCFDFSNVCRISSCSNCCSENAGCCSNNVEGGSCDCNACDCGGCDGCGGCDCSC